MSNSSRAEFKSYCVAVDEGRMTVEEACEKLQICRATWYNWKRQAGLTNPRLGREIVVIDDAEFAKWQEAIARGEVTPKYVMEWLGISSATYYRLRREYNERNKRRVDVKTEEMIDWLRSNALIDAKGRGGTEVVVDKAMLAKVAARLESLDEELKVCKYFWERPGATDTNVGHKWVSIAESGLPTGNTDEYNVVVRTKYTTILDEEVDQEYVTSAWYQPNEKLWKMDDMYYINALLKPGDVSDGECITHWQPLPGLPEDA